MEITCHDFSENMEMGSTTLLRICIMQILDKLEDLFGFFLFFFCGELYNSSAILFFYYLLSNSYLMSKEK